MAFDDDVASDLNRHRPAEAGKRIAAHLLTQHGSISEAIAATVQSNAVRGASRGRFRVATTISRDALVAFSKGGHAECVLERAGIASLGAREPGYFNQLTVASGAGGAKGERVDAGRIRVGPPELWLLELKPWAGLESPIAACAKLCRYASWLAALARAMVTPFTEWRRLPVKLGLWAPAPYFERHGGLSRATEVCNCFHGALESLKPSVPELARFIFTPVPLVIDLGLPNFLALFDATEIARRVSAGCGADAGDLLLPQGSRELGERLQRSLAPLH